MECSENSKVAILKKYKLVLYLRSSIQLSMLVRIVSNYTRDIN